MRSITINGKRINVAGRNVSIRNDRVIVDGKDVTPDSREIHIHVDGDVERLEADVAHSIEVSGAAGCVVTQSGDVDCGEVKGNVSTMSGDIDCEAVDGDVATMSGDITHR